MSVLDSTIVVLSLVGLVAVASWLASRQRSTGDYYLGGRRLPAWTLGLSLAANQVSAISLVGAPAFVALRQGGGLGWLQYELAVPLAMILLIVFAVPFLRRSPGADVYAVIEERLGRGARRVVAVFFLLGRGLSAGVILYTSSLVVDACTGWGLLNSLWIVGGVAVVYTGLGGLVADVLSDVLQLVLLWGGTAIATVLLVLRLRDSDGGLFAGIDRERLVPLELAQHGLGDGATFAFWPMLFGGLFLYLAYYGCDQTQAQRILAAPSDRDARTSLAVAALVRFPLVLTYCLFGVLLARLLVVDLEFASRLQGRPPDALVPEFLVTQLPIGLLGLVVAGILAAALSSIDSALNSLSAVTLEELLPDAPTEGRRAVLLARSITLAWGAWAVVTGWAFSRAGQTVIETVNQVGSLVYGPTLAVFLLAWGSRRADGRSTVWGALVGIGTNLAVARLLPEVSWLWWNVIGCVVGVTCGHLLGRARSELPVRRDRDEQRHETRHWVLILGIELAVVFIGLAALTLAVT